MKTIQISCQGAGVIAIDLLHPLQDDFKTLDKDNYLKLKNQILDEGFSSPIYVWEDPLDAKLKILDGHQRYQTLILMRDKEHYLIPQIPVVYVEAENVQQAIRKLVAFASQFGTLHEQGFLDLIRKYEIKLKDIHIKINLPSIDISKSLQEIEEKIKSSVNFSAKESEPKPKEYMIAIFCQNEKEQSNMYDELKNRGFECKII